MGDSAKKRKKRQRQEQQAKLLMAKNDALATPNINHQKTAAKNGSNVTLATKTAPEKQQSIPTVSKVIEDGIHSMSSPSISCTLGDKDSDCEGSSAIHSVPNPKLPENALLVLDDMPVRKLAAGNTNSDAKTQQVPEIEKMPIDTNAKMAPYASLFANNRSP